MSNNSKIEWTQKTWNPVTGCSKVSQGCKNCYAEVIANRFPRTGIIPGSEIEYNTADAPKNEKFAVLLHRDRLEQPLHWRKPATVFVNSMSDLFHEDVPFEFITKVFAIMALSPRHTFQILTKRPQRAVNYFNYIHSPEHHRNAKEKIQKYAHPYLLEYDSFEFPLKNVWLGVSVEDQATADERIPLLLQIPAAVRFLSCEPLLGEVDLKLPTKTWTDSDGDKRCDHCCNKDRCDDHSHYYRPQCPYCRGTGDGKIIDWVICGSESGHGARPMDIEWAEKLMQDCKAAGVPFFMKQICVNGKKIEYEAFPVNLKVRQMPNEK